MFNKGDKVCFIDDTEKDVFIVYEVYNEHQVSLSLLDYPDTEQDFMVDTRTLELA